MNKLTRILGVFLLSALFLTGCYSSNKTTQGLIDKVNIIPSSWLSTSSKKEDKITKSESIKSKTSQNVSTKYGFVVIDSDNQDAPMRVYPDSTKDFARIPVNTKLAVLDKKVTRVTKWMPSGITWYKVEYNGVSGWVSEFMTKSADLHN